jgi:type I restriction-modification system DNA methylase subunit
MGKQEARGFEVGEVDLVIMNPPFTSWDNMDSDYRNNLRTRFSLRSNYRDLICFKPSQQLFFLFLADIFVKDGGRMVAVLPLTTFTANSFHNFSDIW